MNRVFPMVLMVLMLCVVGFGFARGWFAFSTPSSPESNNYNINLSVDPDKAKQDVEVLRDKATESIGTTSQ